MSGDKQIPASKRKHGISDEHVDLDADLELRDVDRSSSKKRAEVNSRVLSS
jgi:hypothetical protein